MYSRYYHNGSCALDSFILNPFLCLCQHHHFSEGVWNVPSQQPPLSVKSCLTYQISICGSYFKRHPFAVSIRDALLFRKWGKETEKEKRKSISVERQPSAVSWMSEVEFTRQRRRVQCRHAATLSLERRMRNNRQLKENRSLLARSKSSGKMSAISKWQLCFVTLFFL